MSSEGEKIEELRIKRAKLLELKAQSHLRTLHGQRLADIVATVVGQSVTLAEFDAASRKSLSLDWPSDLRTAPGLVAAYISRDEASCLLACFQKSLAVVSGEIGFHGKDYLGLARLKDVNPIDLLRVSELAEDSVLFYVENPLGVILVDCYPSQPGEPFSVVVQGDDLARGLAPCFQRGIGTE